VKSVERGRGRGACSGRLRLQPYTPPHCSLAASRPRRFARRFTIFFAFLLKKVKRSGQTEEEASPQGARGAAERRRDQRWCGQQQTGSSGGGDGGGAAAAVAGGGTRIRQKYSYLVAPASDSRGEWRSEGVEVL
jgi:hypothetical protein